MWLFGLFACHGPAPVEAGPHEPTIGESAADTSAPPDTAADTAPDTAPDTGTDTAPPDRSVLQGFVPTNIVVIHTDTLRYDHTPWYGYTRDTFPRLSARSGWVRWERMYATSGWTAPSTTSMLTGLDVQHHGVRMVNELYHDSLLAPTFASLYAEQGFVTIFVSGNELFELPAGLTEGFDVVELPAFEPLNSAASVSVVFEALDRLTPGTPFMVHMQAFDPHQPWRPGPEDIGTWSDPDAIPFELYAQSDAQKAMLTDALASGNPERVESAEQAVVDLYDEELLGLDRSIEGLLLGLESRRLLDSTLVVFTADHGETLFDRNTNFGHGASLYEELVRVPFLFYNPALVDTSIDDCLGTTMDLHPTLLAALGIPVPEGLDGRPLQDGCQPIVTSTIYREGDEASDLNLLQMSAVTSAYKLLRVCGVQELGFDLLADPGSLEALPSIARTPFGVLSEALDTVEAEAADAWPGTSCVVTE